MTLGRFADMAHLRDEAGDLLRSVLQLGTECAWEQAELAGATQANIEARKEIYARLGRKLKVAFLGGAFDPTGVEIAFTREFDLSDKLLRSLFPTC